MCIRDSWMHQAMVSMDGEKMSKSLGNLVFVSDLVKDWDPPVSYTHLTLPTSDLV